MIKMRKIKLHHTKKSDHCHYTGKFRGAAHCICSLIFKVPKENPVVIHNGSTYDYHFIIKELAEEFEGQFECLGEDTEKYITFSVPIKKAAVNSEKEDENDNDSKKEEDNNSEKENDDNSKKKKTITYKIKFIDSYRFTQSKLSDLLQSYLEFTIRNANHAWKENKIKSECDFIGLKNNRLNYKYKECGKKCTKLRNKAIKNFPSLYKFCNGNLNKFVLLLRKGVYPYILMAGKNLMKLQYHPKKLITAN